MTAGLGTPQGFSVGQFFSAFWMKPPAASATGNVLDMRNSFLSAVIALRHPDGG
jgi:hypothetical protein